MLLHMNRCICLLGPAYVLKSWNQIGYCHCHFLFHLDCSHGTFFITAKTPASQTKSVGLSNSEIETPQTICLYGI